ncbi:MAG: hypothetical protein GX045_03870 [Clostridiaceae bacterium]|jgi:hypothetical protein|nr:hypothetical protein [Clostridiaceae bacterium]
MEKYLRVKMSDGSVYDIPAEVIAEHRANYFENNSAEKLAYHSSSVQPRLRKAEKEFALNNDEVLIDWATNKMSWKDIKKYALKVDLSNHEEEWKSVEKRIITK